MSKLFLPFHVCKRSFGYYVYRWEDETKRSASRVSHHCFYEDAQKEAYGKTKNGCVRKKHNNMEIDFDELGRLYW